MQGKTEEVDLPRLPKPMKINERNCRESMLRHGGLRCWIIELSDVSNPHSIELKIFFDDTIECMPWSQWENKRDFVVPSSSGSHLSSCTESKPEGKLCPFARNITSECRSQMSNTFQRWLSCGFSHNNDIMPYRASFYVMRMSEDFFVFKHLFLCCLTLRHTRILSLCFMWSCKKNEQVLVNIQKSSKSIFGL